MGNENDMNENLWSTCIYINQYLELLSTNRAQTLNKIWCSISIYCKSFDEKLYLHVSGCSFLGDIFNEADIK